MSHFVCLDGCGTRVTGPDQFCTGCVIGESVDDAERAEQSDADLATVRFLADFAQRFPSTITRVPVKLELGERIALRWRGNRWTARATKEGVVCDIQGIDGNNSNDAARQALTALRLSQPEIDS